MASRPGARADAARPGRRGWRSLALVVGLTVAVSSAPALGAEGDGQSQRERAESELDAAKAEDSEIAAGLVTINESLHDTQAKIDAAEQQLADAQAAQATAAEDLAVSTAAQEQIESQLTDKAVEGFVSGQTDTGLFFVDDNMNTAVRKAQLFQQANTSTAELVEEYRGYKDDAEVAEAQAAQATADAEALQAQLATEKATLEQQQATQLELKAEAEARIARWETELSAYAAEDGGIQQLISTSGGASVGPASSRGFQRPLNAPITSNFGYRVHPVYGTRKLHSGTDFGAPGGTPIAAIGDGVVISAARRGGYGNTVIIDHGGGITSLYAHMRGYATSTGANVSRGDIIGYVGTTGTSTGNHLHLEIRVNGTATNPLPYLP
ncbi:MAG: M23 family metallopeptidase [Acidimicrobiales bacterium]